jgi:uncharacterized peroxidase-related enzyme
MAYIKIIDPDEAEGKLQEIYRLVSGPAGQVDQVLQVHSLRPHSLEGHMALYKAVLHHHGNTVPEWFLEAIGVLVSRLNGCDYCAVHHVAGMRRLMEKQGLSFADHDDALRQQRPGMPFSEPEQAALAYAAKLTQTPAAIGEADIKGLRRQGFDDAEILEINQVAAYFAYANRTVTGLGVNTQGEALGLSPRADEGEQGWRHD